MGFGVSVSTSMISPNTASHLRAPEIFGHSITSGWRKLLISSKIAHTSQPIHKYTAMGIKIRMVRRETVL